MADLVQQYCSYMAKHTQGRRSKPRQRPVSIYLFKVINRNTKKKCEICSKLTMKTSSSISIIDFEQVNVSWIPSHLSK